MKARFLGAAVALVTLALAATALGADAAATAPAASDAGIVGVSTLAVGHVPAPPGGKRPRSIAGSERAAGFHLARPQNFGRGGGDYVVLAPTAPRARDIATGRGFGFEPGSPREACFAEEMRFGQEEDDDDKTWTPALQPQVMLNASLQNGRPPVVAVHSERLVQEAGGAVLESADAWIDPVTRGVRLIGRSTLPLTRVATVLGGSVVYAGRDGGVVHVVFTSPPDQDASRRGSQLFAAVDGGLASSQCGYLRVPLEADKGQGHTATFVSDVQLATLTASGKPLPADRAKAPPSHVIPSLLGGGERVENRFRPVHVHASVSWTSRDKEALLSVASGWDARERAQPF